jgi:hypothetical protein
VSDAKADRIRAKISASQARSRGEGTPRKAKPKAKDTASRPRSDDRGFIARAVEDHPLALVAGGLALGAIAAALIPAAAGRKLGQRVLGLATVAGELGALYGHRAWDAAAEGARAGQDKLEDFGEVLAEQSADARRKAAELGSIAGKRASEIAEAAARNAREAGTSALKAIGELSERARH